MSATYNTKPWQLKLANQVSDALRAHKDWLGARFTTATADDHSQQQQNGEPVRLLDYACGTGAITQALGSAVTQIRGIDISENMVAAYNSAARDSGLTEAQAHAIVGDLCAAAEPAVEISGAEFRDFDIAVIGLGFHHFEDPARALQRLGERLKPALGVLVVVDFLPFGDGPGDVRPEGDHGHGHGHDHGHGHGHAPEFPDMQHTIKHNGFNAEQMRALYEAAGFEDFGFVTLPEPAVMELKHGTVQRTLFIAKARKAATA